MDTYYRELMQKERATFERVLASRLNLQEREIERKFHKKQKETKARMDKAEALENRYNESQNHAKRQMKEIESLKKQKT